MDANQGLQSNGFYMNPGFLRALKEIDLVKLAPEFRGVLHIVSEATEHSEQLKNAWRDSPCYEFRHTPAPGDWNYVDVYGSILLPQPVIQGIVEWIANTEA
ncbi:MAG: hypothetical protein EX270_13880 [Pseudomonadales bacterium]|nr:MAG: hypothetical protein EX270_13880 [Pseudomonadales bacterium]